MAPNDNGFSDDRRQRFRSLVDRQIQAKLESDARPDRGTTVTDAHPPDRSRAVPQATPDDAAPLQEATQPDVIDPTHDQNPARDQQPAFARFYARLRRRRWLHAIDDHVPYICVSLFVGLLALLLFVPPHSRYSSASMPALQRMEFAATFSNASQSLRNISYVDDSIRANARHASDQADKVPALAEQAASMIRHQLIPAVDQARVNAPDCGAVIKTIVEHLNATQDLVLDTLKHLTEILQYTRNAVGNLERAIKLTSTDCSQLYREEINRMQWYRDPDPKSQEPPYIACNIRLGDLKRCKDALDVIIENLEVEKRLWDAFHATFRDAPSTISGWVNGTGGCNANYVTAFLHNVSREADPLIGSTER